MKETWNPAEISEDIKPVNYVNADSWNAAELNEAINIFGINYPVDTWNPAELDEKARNIISDITSVKTIHGNPISFKTINGGYAKNCEVSFSPIQSGSGDPSPENVRPIIGMDSLHLYQDTEQTETPETTHTATFPSTVYGGVWKPQEGKAIIDKAIVDMGDLTYDNYSEGVIQVSKNNIETVSGSNPKRTYDCIIICESIVVSIQTANQVRFLSDLTPAQFKESMDGYKMCFELATPQEITLTAEQIELLKGNNVLFTDGDNITLKYTKLALPEDSDSLSLNQKVKKAIEIIKGKAIEETKKSTTKGRRKKS